MDTTTIAMDFQHFLQKTQRQNSLHQNIFSQITLVKKQGRRDLSA